MASKDISSLTLATSLSGAELVHISKGGLSYKAPIYRANKSGFMGAMVRLDSDRTAQNLTTVTDIAWDSAVYDTHGFWNASSATLLKCPDGIRAAYVQCTYHIGITNATAAGYAYSSLVNVGTAKPTTISDFGRQLNQTIYRMNLTGPPVPHIDGGSMYFYCRAYVQSDTSVTIESQASFFSIAVVGIM